MSDRDRGLRGLAVYAISVLGGVTAIASWLCARRLSIGDPGSRALILTAMWISTVARLLATRVVDRGWRAPFPLNQWGSPRIAVLAVPLGIVAAIYFGAYVTAAFAGVPREPPVWHGLGVALNVAVNLPLLAAIDLAGGLGEELGWRGYMQPRLDELRVPGAVLCVIVLESLFHLPLIVLAGYLGDESWAASFALFFGLKLGATPVWTWATYRWRTIWLAAWFHAFHNAVSQVLAPKIFGAGPPYMLGESGVLPIAWYLLAAATVLIQLRMRGETWRTFVARAVDVEQPSATSHLSRHGGRERVRKPAHE